MINGRQVWGALLFVLTLAAAAAANGKYYEVVYPPSRKPGELTLGVGYTLWVPDGVEELRTVVVHQHGCGAAACLAGATAAYDLHWQALARKWDGALLGPSYHQDEKDDCLLWCDPRNGSDKSFRKALADLAVLSHHPELQNIPWCLWGHSGGGHWASVMLTMHPERIVAVWLRSGATGLFRDRSDRTETDVPLAVYEVPIMCNPGVKEKTGRFARIWDGMLENFRTYRAKGAPIGLAPDPRTAHECGDSRYLAIPFLDACLTMRLPERESKDQTLRRVDMSTAWLAPLLGEEAFPAAEFKGKPDEAVWLPNEAVAKAWIEYVKTGSVSDATPPPAPLNVHVSSKGDQGKEIVWSANADFESGIASFVVLRDGRELAKVQQQPVSKFGRPLFQSMTYHDTPAQPIPQMRYIDTSTKPNETHTYSVITINSVGLRSEASAASSSNWTSLPAQAPSHR